MECSYVAFHRRYYACNCFHSFPTFRILLNHRRVDCCILYQSIERRCCFQMALFGELRIVDCQIQAVNSKQVN